MSIDVMEHFLKKLKDGEASSKKLKQFRINVDKLHNVKTAFINKEYGLKNLNKRFLLPEKVKEKYKDHIKTTEYFTYDYGYVLEP